MKFNTTLDFPVNRLLKAFYALDGVPTGTDPLGVGILNVLKGRSAVARLLILSVRIPMES